MMPLEIDLSKAYLLADLVTIADEKPSCMFSSQMLSRHLGALQIPGERA